MTFVTNFARVGRVRRLRRGQRGRRAAHADPVGPAICLAAIVALFYWATKQAGRVLFGRGLEPAATTPR